MNLSSSAMRALKTLPSLVLGMSYSTFAFLDGYPLPTCLATARWPQQARATLSMPQRGINTYKSLHKPLRGYRLSVLPSCSERKPRKRRSAPSFLIVSLSHHSCPTQSSRFILSLATSSPPCLRNHPSLVLPFRATFCLKYRFWPRYLSTSELSRIAPN